MIAYVFRGHCSVHRQLVAAHLLPARLTEGLFFRRVAVYIIRKRKRFVVSSVNPAHHLVIPDPPFMLQRRKDCRLLRRELRHHFIIHRFVCVEAVNRIQISAEILRPVKCGQLIFQGQRLKLPFQFLKRCVRFASAMKRHCKII